jgi:hypothetical protein
MVHVEVQPVQIYDSSDQIDNAGERPAGGRGNGEGSPVDDRTYNVLQALTSTLEAIDAYELYAAQAGQAALFEGLVTTERRNAELLLAELGTCLEALRAGRGETSPTHGGQHLGA